MPGGSGLMVSRGQAIFIAYLCLINIFLSIFPFELTLPLYNYPNNHAHLVAIIGDRTGVLAFANFAAIFLFSSRNNLLLWLTDWSHSTYLLLHRWVAYISILQTVLHSILMLYYYTKFKDVKAETKLPYWYWGIIATLVLVLMWPSSLLVVRRRSYQLFLSAHQILAVLALVGGFLHLWYLFKWNWGYEIFIYIAGGMWGLDRLWRVARVIRNGVAIAHVTLVQQNAEYLKVQIDGIVAESNVYLYFPTLSWRIWESHPFSVLSAFTGLPSAVRECQRRAFRDVTEVDMEKTAPASTVETQKGGDLPGHNSSQESVSSISRNIRPATTLLIRAQKGMTRTLLDRVIANEGSLRLPVLVESSYHPNPAVKQLSTCSTLLAIAGGVGITGVLPAVHTFGGLRTKLFWGVRSRAVVDSIQNELQQLGDTVEIETSIGKRLDLKKILEEELARSAEQGDIGIMICGPAKMADEVTGIIGQLVGSGRMRRGVVLVNESFSW